MFQIEQEYQPITKKNRKCIQFQETYLQIRLLTIENRVQKAKSNNNNCGIHMADHTHRCTSFK